MNTCAPMKWQHCKRIRASLTKRWNSWTGVLHYRFSIVLKATKPLYTNRSEMQFIEGQQAYNITMFYTQFSIYSMSAQRIVEKGFDW